MPGGPSSANSGSLAQNQAIMNSANTPEATFAVRWFSARAVRQALARAQVLSSAMSEADAAKAFIDYLRTPAAIKAIKAAGMTPG